LDWSYVGNVGPEEVAFASSQPTNMPGDSLVFYEETSTSNPTEDLRSQDIADFTQGIAICKEVKGFLRFQHNG
jgi:hypothetical protein